MYQEYLMHARHDDRLRTAAKDQLAAQARRARAARRRDTEPDPVPRLMRALQRLARAWAGRATQYSAQAENNHEQIAMRHIHLTAAAMEAPKPSPVPERDETAEPCARS